MNDAERNSLLRRLTELDFMTVDLGLFLIHTQQTKKQ